MDIPKEAWDKVVNQVASNKQRIDALESSKGSNNSSTYSGPKKMWLKWEKFDQAECEMIVSGVSEKEFKGHKYYELNGKVGNYDLCTAIKKGSGEKSMSVAPTLTAGMKLRLVGKYDDKYEKWTTIIDDVLSDTQSVSFGNEVGEITIDDIPFD